MEYSLLSIDPETETPGSVTVKTGAKLFFNFRKAFYIERGTADWNLLKTMAEPQGSTCEVCSTAFCLQLCQASQFLSRSQQLRRAV